jgi:hypothetical protein
MGHRLPSRVRMSRRKAPACERQRKLLKPPSPELLKHMCKLQRNQSHSGPFNTTRCLDITSEMTSSVPVLVSPLGSFALWSGYKCKNDHLANLGRPDVHFFDVSSSRSYLWNPASPSAGLQATRTIFVLEYLLSRDATIPTIPCCT